MVEEEKLDRPEEGGGEKKGGGTVMYDECYPYDNPSSPSPHYNTVVHTICGGRPGSASELWPRLWQAGHRHRRGGWQ